MTDLERFAAQAGLRNIRLNRRSILRRALALGLGASLSTGLLAACGGDDEDAVEDAVTAVSGAAGGTATTEPAATQATTEGAATTVATAAAESTAPATAAGGGASEATGEVIFVEGTDVTAFDPQIITDTPTWSVAYLIYDSLLTFDKELNVEPMLATDWEVSEDNLTWTFNMRDDATFSDGTPVTASDVKFTFDRIRAEQTASPYRALFQIIEEVTAVDATTVEFRTSAPFPDLTINVAGTSAGILSEAVTTQYSVADYGRNPIGAGPFVVGEWVPGEFVKFEARSDYWGEQPKVATITYRPVPEGSTRAAMVRTGEADIVVKISPEDVPALKDESGVTVHELKSMYQISFEMNAAIEDPPLNNQQVRQAINYAVDKEAIVKSILQGLGEPMVSPFGPGIQYRVELEPYTYDPDRAKQLLTDAGYPDGFDMTLWSPDGRYLKDRQVAEAVQGYLQEVGINADLQIWEWAPYVTAIREDPTRQAMMLGRATPGADYTATRLFAKASWGQYNVTNFSDPEIEDLLVQGRTTFGDEQRAEIYAQIQEIWWDQAPWIFLHNQRAIVATRDSIEGFDMWPQEVMLLRGVSKTS